MIICANIYRTNEQIEIIERIIMISTILIILGVAWFCVGSIIVIKRYKEKKNK